MAYRASLAQSRAPDGGLTVTGDRWQRVKALFQAAVEHPPEERDAFLSSATGGDAELRREVESLLASDAQDVGFLDRLQSRSLLSAGRVALMSFDGCDLSEDLQANGEE
jgi:hypothetical protein